MSSETAGACLPYSLSRCFAILGKRGGSIPIFLCCRKNEEEEENKKFPLLPCVGPGLAGVASARAARASERMEAEEPRRASRRPSRPEVRRAMSEHAILQTEDQKRRIEANQMAKHRKFLHVHAEDSDVTDIDSEEEELSERERLDRDFRSSPAVRAPRLEEEIKLFRDATSGIRKLASVVDSQKRLRLGGLEKVMARNTVMAATGSMVLVSMRAKRYREEIYRGTGVNSLLGRPYQPFQVGRLSRQHSVAGGVVDEESSQECGKQVKALFASRHQSRSAEAVPKPSTVEMHEIGLSGQIEMSAKRYERKVFFLDLSKYPKTQTRGKSIEVTLESTEGDPDLYMAIAEPPTEKEYTWRSVREGSDVILIHPKDPNYIADGTYYIGVSCAISDTAFILYGRLRETESGDDAQLFKRMQEVTYQTMKRTLKDSNHRRKLCAGGKSFQQIMHKDAQAVTQAIRPPHAQSSSALTTADVAPELSAHAAVPTTRRRTLAESLEGITAQLSLSIDTYSLGDELQDASIDGEEPKAAFLTESSADARGGMIERRRREPRPETPAELEKQFKNLTGIFSQGR